MNATEIQVLVEEVNRLRTMTYCAYCGHEEPVDGDGLKIAEHIRTCPKHPMRAVEDEVERLRTAIRQHRDERGDDRCHGDDGRLYAFLPEGDTRPDRETAVTLENCQKFIECRQTGREYISPQKRIEELEAEGGDSEPEPSKELGVLLNDLSTEDRDALVHFAWFLTWKKRAEK